RSVLVSALAALVLASSAQGAVPHTVQPGESLFSIASANNFTTRSIAVFNGLSEDAPLVAGTTIQIPSEAEGAAALGTAAPSTGTPAPASSAGAEAPPVLGG